MYKKLLLWIILFFISVPVFANSCDIEYKNNYKFNPLMQKKLDTFLEVVENKKDIYSNNEKYDKLLILLNRELIKLKYKYKNYPKILMLIKYLKGGVNNMRCKLLKESDNTDFDNKKSEKVQEILIKWCDDKSCNKELDFNESYINKEVLVKSDNYETIAYISKPKWTDLDIVILLHGTTNDDEKSKDAAKGMPELIWADSYLKNKFLISIAYKETDIAIWDEVLEVEEAFLAIKDTFSKNKIYLLWHSRWGYVTNILNTKYESDWVIVNWTGPLDIWKTCEIISNNPNPRWAWVEMKKFCTDLMWDRYWNNYSSEEYNNLALKSHICNSKSPILFVQGDRDKPIQTSWMKELEKVMSSGSCDIDYKVLWIEWAWHGDTFKQSNVWEKITDFISK